MLTLYPAIFYKEQDGSYGVVFPDLNHLSTCGETFAEAMQMAVDCLAGYVYTEKQDGHELPPPSSIENIDIHCEDDEGDTYVLAFVNVVSVDVDEYAKKHFCATVKKTLTIPRWLNDEAKARHLDLSQVLQAALMKELETQARR